MVATYMILSHVIYCLEEVRYYLFLSWFVLPIAGLHEDSLSMVWERLVLGLSPLSLTCTVIMQLSGLILFLLCMEEVSVRT